MRGPSTVLGRGEGNYETLQDDDLFFKSRVKPKRMMKRFRITRRQCKASDTVPEIHCAGTEGFDQLEPKMRIINVLSRKTISEIKLKRTDTTLDLSQKA